MELCQISKAGLPSRIRGSSGSGRFRMDGVSERPWDEYPSQWKAIESISKKLSVNHEDGFRQWVRQSRDRRRAASWLDGG